MKKNTPVKSVTSSASKNLYEPGITVNVGGTEYKINNMYQQPNGDIYIEARTIGSKSKIWDTMIDMSGGDIQKIEY